MNKISNELIAIINPHIEYDRDSLISKLIIRINIIVNSIVEFE